MKAQETACETCQTCGQRSRGSEWWLSIVDKSRVGASEQHAWLASMPTLEDAIANCTNPAWLMFLFASTTPRGSERWKRVVLAACACAELTVSLGMPGAESYIEAVARLRWWAEGAETEQRAIDALNDTLNHNGVFRDHRAVYMLRHVAFPLPGPDQLLTPQDVAAMIVNDAYAALLPYCSASDLNVYIVSLIRKNMGEGDGDAMTDDITALRAQLDQARADLAASRDNERRLTDALAEARRCRVYVVGVAHAAARSIRSALDGLDNMSTRDVLCSVADALFSLRK